MSSSTALPATAETDSSSNSGSDTEDPDLWTTSAAAKLPKKVRGLQEPLFPPDSPILTSSITSSMASSIVSSASSASSAFLPRGAVLSGGAGKDPFASGFKDIHELLRQEVETGRPLSSLTDEGEDVTGALLIRSGSSITTSVEESPSALLTSLGAVDSHPLRVTKSEQSLMEQLVKDEEQRSRARRLQERQQQQILQLQLKRHLSASPPPLVEEDVKEEEGAEVGGETSRHSRKDSKSWNPFDDPATAGVGGTATAGEKGTEGRSAGGGKKQPIKEKTIRINLREFGKGKSLGVILRLSSHQRQSVTCCHFLFFSFIFFSFFFFFFEKKNNKKTITALAQDCTRKGQRKRPRLPRL